MLEMILNAADKPYYDNANVDKSKRPIMATFIDGKTLFDQAKDEHVQYVNAFLCAFGLVSNKDQAAIYATHFSTDSTTQKLLEKFPRKAPFEKYSYRYSNFKLDDLAVALMKANFGNLCHGYIGCEMKSPFHGGYFHNEICLFTPSECITATLAKVVSIDACNTIKCNDIIKNTFGNIGSKAHYVDIIRAYAAAADYQPFAGGSRHGVLGGGGEGDDKDDDDERKCHNMKPKFGEEDEGTNKEIKVRGDLSNLFTL
jgi:hypothetical protein